MAWTHVQDTPGGNATANTASGTSLNLGAFGSAVTLNNFVVVWFHAEGGANTIATISVTDNGSTPNTYTQLVALKVTDSGGFAVVGSIYLAKITHNPSAGNLNPQVNTSISASLLMGCAAEFSGGSSTTDGSSTNSSTTNWTPSCGNMTTTNSGDLLLAEMSTGVSTGTASWTDPTSYTSVGKQTNASSFDIMQGLYRIPGTTVTNNNPTWNSFSPTNQGGVAVQVALQPPSSFVGGDDDGVGFSVVAYKHRLPHMQRPARKWWRTEGGILVPERRIVPARRAA
jgi:hypothetical protein